MGIEDTIRQYRKAAELLEPRGLVPPSLRVLIDKMEAFKATPVGERTPEELDRLRWLARVVRREIKKIRARHGI